jgi:hypothetical protein
MGGAIFGANIIEAMPMGNKIQKVILPASQAVT